MSRDHVRLGIYRQQAELHGTLKLSKANLLWLFEMAERGIDAEGKVLADPEGMPDAVICALELFNPLPRQRRRRAKVPEPG
jgi:hypothetical protein